MNYEAIYIISSIPGTYIIYKFMAAFFAEKRTSERVEAFSYIAYFIITTMAYLLINVPVIMMVCNLVLFFLLSLNYESNMKKRISAVFMIYLVLMCIEMVVVILSGYLNFQIASKNEYSSVWGLISIKLLSYIVALIFNNYSNIRRGGMVPISYWVCIMILPLSTLYVSLMIFQAIGLSIIQKTISVAVMFMINFTTFYLYDSIATALRNKMEKSLVEQQNEYYDRQLKLMEASVKTTRIMRHDWKNHMSTVSSLIRNGESEEALVHVQEILNVCKGKKDYSNSGNVIIDSILNFKLQEAEQNNINVSIALCIPDKLKVQSFDMAIILGNLVDNAMTALKNVKGEKYIDIRIKYSRGRLIIKVDNPYSDKLYEANGKLVTTKKNRENHGIGLNSIRNILKNYNGIMETEFEKNIFTNTIYMYVD